MFKQESVLPSGSASRGWGWRLAVFCARAVEARSGPFQL